MKSRKKETGDEKIMQSRLKSIMNCAWSDMSDDQKKQVLAQLPNPDHTLYNKFHTCLRENRAKLPEWFKQDR